MIYSKDDISKLYTKMVKETLEYGHINIPSMSGSQGEDSRIDINIGGRIRRILIDKIYEISIGDVILIKVIDFIDTGSNLYWNDRGDLVQSFYFIPIKGSSNYYMADILDFDQIKVKRKMRREAKHSDTGWTNLDSKYYPIFKKIVQSFNIPGWKRFDIKSVSVKNYNGIKYYRVTKVNGGTILLKRKDTKFYRG